MAKRVQSRSWVGCLNDYTDEDVAALKALTYTYLAIGHHVGEKRGRPHIHIVIQFKNPRGWPKTNKRIHWEIRRGNIQQNLNYLNKNNRLEEFGERPRDPKGIDEQWDEFVSELRQGRVDKYSRMFARYEGYARRRLAEVVPKKDYDGDLKAKNLWIWGPPRTGKSLLVRTTFDSSQIYTKYLNKWWDNYERQPCVLIEDADPTQCKYLAHHFKIWCDRYSFGAEIKNGRMQINPCDYHFIVTSNYSIEDCFEGVDYSAISARFDVLFMA